MAKQIIGLLIILLLIGAVLLFWWQDQKDVRELNKGLPSGVRVTESLIGDEYKVVNKIDGYEFKVPEGWKGLASIDYAPEKEELGYIFDSIGLEGNEGAGRIVGIGYFKKKSSATTANLAEWAKDIIYISGSSVDIKSDKIGDLEIVKTLDRLDAITGYAYFLKNKSGVYVITGGSEEFIREIISNGEW